MESLWGEEFTIKETPRQTKKILEKIKKPKEPVIVEKAIKSKKLSVEERLSIINENVLKILGVYKENTVVIKTKEQLIEYIDKAIDNGIIAIDTETNNSLDPLTCKLMGPCIYTPEMKNAYIPLNHKNHLTDERLDWQLTEQDIKEQFLRLSNTNILMHNGKFDYQVIKCTTGVVLNIYWDTMIGAKVLDENEKSAGLKQQYIDKIDPSIEKYSIDHLFKDVEYAYVDPEIFALYAATDAYMTYKLYEWQLARFELPENKGIYSLFTNIEMPVVTVTAEMELAGIELDKGYSELLSLKYHKILDDIDIKINDELDNLRDKIEKWRLTPEANEKILKKDSQPDDLKYTKSKNEQLTDPINVASPTQLSILLYDILQVEVVDKEKPRGTGEEILEKINLPLAELILERRGILKLLNAFIDALPLTANYIDGRVHCHFNQYGAATGRFSSSDPNLQQIPSKNKEIRLMFKASTKYANIDCSDNVIECDLATEILSNGEYKFVKQINIGDVVDIDFEDGCMSHEVVKNIIIEDSRCKVVF